MEEQRQLIREITHDVCDHLNLDPYDFNGSVFMSWNNVALFRRAPDRAMRFSTYVINLSTLTPTLKSPYKKEPTEQIKEKLQKLDIALLCGTN